jgi:hypothetical protein
MDTMKESNREKLAEACPTRFSQDERELSMTPGAHEDVPYPPLTLFRSLSDYRLAVAEGRDRGRLLTIFDASFERVKRHFRSEEALAGQIAWPYGQRHASHCRIEEALAAYRARLAGDAPLDAAECAHVFDALLVQLVRDCPLR